MLFIADTGSRALLDLLIDEYNSNNVTVHLFKNDYVPSWLSLVGDFMESDFSGYSPAAVSSWAFQGFAGQVGYMGSVDSVLFSVAVGTTLPQLAFGYWIEDMSGTLLWAERDPSGPVNMSSVGNSYEIFPRLGLSNCPP